MRVRPLLITVHRWVGLVAALFLALLGISGAIIVFEDPLNDWLNSRIAIVAPRGTELPVAELVRRIEAARPGYRVTGADFGQDARHTDAVSLEADGHPELDLFVDPYDARVLGSTADERNWLTPIHQFHTHLLAGSFGRAVVGWAGVGLVFLAVVGLVLWWPSKTFWIRRGGGVTGWRWMFDLHNALGGLSWLFLLVFGITGMTIHWSSEAMTWASRLTSAAVPADFPRAAPQCAGQPGPSLSLDRISDAAAAAVPGARITTVMLPDSVTRPARVIMKFPEDHTPAGRTNVFVASCNASVIEARNVRAASVAYKAVAMWTREIHTGDVGGWPTRILACLASLTAAAMAVTGPWLWWRRRGVGATDR